MTEFERDMKRAHARRDRRTKQVKATYFRRLDRIQDDFNADSREAQQKHFVTGNTDR